ncbi:MAG: ABC transporter ATP-binding protein, partial [Trueperaceae bacterium]|nr:ABC transporter ATP-binding protein [Trueperaceae bacterium]
HLASRACNMISGGELQLTFIARALVNEPSVLVLDEPESHLDFKKQLIILELVESLAHEDGISCIMNTHFPNNALRVADRILLLGHGGKHTFGPAREVLTAEQVASYFEVNAQFTTVASERGEWPVLHPVSLIPSEGETHV